MEQKWEILTDWKINLETEEDSFEYFNEEAFIPGHIYRIHVSNGAPIIVEFKHFGCGYDHSMTKTYPRVLMCDGAADVHIKNITHIFAYNIDGDDDEDVSSTSTESTKTVNDSKFKDFVVSKHSYRVNEKLKNIEKVSRLSTDKMHINGELKITGIDITVDRYPNPPSQGVRIELPTGDEITIPVSDHPWVENSTGQNFPVFIEEDTLELSWHKDLVAGELYITMNKLGKKQLVLIRCIRNSEIEYTVCTSRYSRVRDDCGYYIEAVTFGIKIEEAKECKFIPIKDLIC